MLHEYVRRPFSTPTPHKSTRANICADAAFLLPPSSGLRRKRRQWVNILPVSRVLSLQTRLFIQSEGRTADGGMRRIDSNEIGRSHTRIRARAPFSSASFECSALDLSPARTRSRTTLDNITKVKGSEAGGRFQFTHMLVPPWQNNQMEPPYQPLSIADLSRNLCQKRRHLRGRLQTFKVIRPRPA